LAHWDRAIVVGASSGIGKAIALQLGAGGTRVVLVARRQDMLETVASELNRTPETEIAEVVVCDVRDTAACRRSFKEIVAEGPVDLIVYSSGIMPKGSRNGFPTEEDVTAVETNLTGAIVWLNAAAEYFLSRDSGTIVGIGSIAGDRGRSGNPVYNATKAALATYLESLRYRLTRQGVTVVTVKPGWIRTPMLGERRALLPAANVDTAARQIIEAAKRGRRVAYIPPWWEAISVIFQLTPAWVMERLPV